MAKQYCKDGTLIDVYKLFIYSIERLCSRREVSQPSYRRSRPYRHRKSLLVILVGLAKNLRWRNVNSGRKIDLGTTNSETGGLHGMECFLRKRAQFVSNMMSKMQLVSIATNAH